MFVPAFAEAGPLLLMVRSADAETLAVAVWLLFAVFGSTFVPDAVAVLLRGPVNVGVMFAVSVNCADAPEANCCKEQFTVPGLPGAGLLQVAAAPVFCTSELNVVPGGNGSENVGFGSGLGPLFVTVIVHGIVLPAVAVAGPVFVRAKSLVAIVR